MVDTQRQHTVSKGVHFNVVRKCVGLPSMESKRFSHFGCGTVHAASKHYRISKFVTVLLVYCKSRESYIRLLNAESLRTFGYYQRCALTVNFPPTPTLTLPL